MCPGRPVDARATGARSYEHPSLSGRESVAITKYLMGIERPDPAVEAAVEGAIAWFRRAAIRGIRLIRKPDLLAPRGFDVVVENDPGAASLWARFYDLDTGLPIYSGRDGVVKSSLAEIEIERRTGYSWLGRYAAELLERDYPAWRRRSRSEWSTPTPPRRHRARRRGVSLGERARTRTSVGM